MKSAVLVAEHRTIREILRTTVEPLTLVLALSLALLGTVLGWEAHARSSPAHEERPSLPPAPLRVNAPIEAVAYVDALCARDTAYLLRNTGESAGPMPWEPRLTDWAAPCLRHRYLGALVDRLGRDQYVFTLARPDGSEVLYVVTFGHDGRVAGID